MTAVAAVADMFERLGEDRQCRSDDAEAEGDENETMTRTRTSGGRPDTSELRPTRLGTGRITARLDSFTRSILAHRPGPNRCAPEPGQIRAPPART